MAAKILPSAIVSFVLLWQSVSAVEVRYFYSPLKDACAWGGANTFPATNLTANGGICAFVPSRNRLFACSAPDTVCCASTAQLTLALLTVDCYRSAGDIM
jgi:hypothetical protein